MTTVFLWLDDIRSPPDDASWTVVRTAEEARTVLLAGPVEAASLDHDLGECDECANAFPPRGYRVVTNTCRHRMTGYDLVKWMAETDTWPRSKPAVHSANVVGKANMIAMIERYWTPRVKAARVRVVDHVPFEADVTAEQAIAYVRRLLPWWEERVEMPADGMPGWHTFTEPGDARELGRMRREITVPQSEGEDFSSHIADVCRDLVKYTLAARPSDVLRAMIEPDPDSKVSAVRARRLLPCPFCGESTIRFQPQPGGWRRISCWTCDATIHRLTQDDLGLANAWNSRNGKTDPRFRWDGSDLQNDVHDVVQTALHLDEMAVYEDGFDDLDLTVRFDEAALAELRTQMTAAFGFEVYPLQVPHLRTARDWADFVAQGGFVAKMTAESAAGAAPLEPSPIEGEMLGEYRKRTGRPGTDTLAARTIRWTRRESGLCGWEREEKEEKNQGSAT